MRKGMQEEGLMEKQKKMKKEKWYSMDDSVPG